MCSITLLLRLVLFMLPLIIPSASIKPPYTEEMIKTANEKLKLPYTWIATKSYSLSELLKDMSHLNLNDLNIYRGPILSQLGIDLQNFTDYENKGRLWKHTCHALFSKSQKTAEAVWPPPKFPPADLVESYSIGDRIPILDFYIFDQKQHYNGGGGYNWDIQKIENLVAQPDCDCGQYQRSVCDATIRKYIHFISGKTGIVVGSETPWAEAALLKHNASSVTTIEYMPINTNHPKLKTYHPSKVLDLYLSHSWEEHDFAFIYSSVEHDGLGRYGDPLNPFADLESIARARCLLKHGGVLFLGFPTGADAVAWNAHRIYGIVRLFLVFQGWEVLDMVNSICFKF